VADTGPGIAAEDREQIFRPYYQRSAGYSQSGVGLGLAIVKGIVDCHGGRIELDSDIGKGCDNGPKNPGPSHPSGPAPNAAAPASCVMASRRPNS